MKGTDRQDEKKKKEKEKTNTYCVDRLSHQTCEY